MLPYLGSFLKRYWGPFRLLESNVILMGAGAFLAALVCFWLLPKVWYKLPSDQGKALVKDGQQSKGKPTGAGFVIVNVITVILLLVLPFSWRFFGIIVALYAIMMTGFLDDAAATHWSESKKGFLDVLISVGAVLAFSELEGQIRVWVPFVKGELYMSIWLYVPLASFLLFICINAVNCSDGVDGLAGSLAIMTLLNIGVFLYVIVGYNTMANYFNVPHYGSGAVWATMMFVSAGAFSGYLWHNANPSAVLMGDAGSRFLGLLIGIGALATGNMFIFIVVAPMLVINGGSGLVKLIILRVLKKCGSDVRQPIRNATNPQNPGKFADEEAEQKQLWLVRKLHSIRFPLHDHCKNRLKWSNTQVMIRFLLLQAFITPILLLIIIKLR